MGYVVKFICTKCKLQLNEKQLGEVVDFLKSKVGPGEVTLPSGMRYGGKNYTLNYLKLTCTGNAVKISAHAFEMVGKKEKGKNSFYDIKCESKWVTEPSIEIVKKVFEKYSGYLEGHYRGEDGAEWGHFSIKNGEVTPTVDKLTKDEEQKLERQVTIVEAEIKAVEKYLERGWPPASLQVGGVVKIKKSEIALVA